MGSCEISVIRLMDADINDTASIRALFADALSELRPRVLADLSGLSELHGPLIAAIIIASSELTGDARFAVYAPQRIVQQMHDWKLTDAWPCFDVWDQATDYLCAESN